MREVGWVIFDEIHYMRDPGINCISDLFICIHQEHAFSNNLRVFVRSCGYGAETGEKFFPIPAVLVQYACNYALSLA